VLRKVRHRRIRAKVKGTPIRPRLNVFRSNRHIYAAIIDDEHGVTLASACTKNLEDSLESTKDTEAAKAIGKAIAEAALSAGFDTVVFDRSGYLYHGRIKELADAAREGGLKF
jgi:large subunit ribosomal protein L18